MREVLVVGDINLDVLVRPQRPIQLGTDVPAEILQRPGGAGGNVAVALARLGVSTTLAGCVGASDSAAITGHLRASGVALAVRSVAAARTGAIVAIIGPDGERSFASDRGANLALRESDLTDALIAAHRHVYVSGYTLFDPESRGAARTALRRALALGATVSVDPASVAPLRSYGVASFHRDIEGVHLLLPNANEARALTGLADIEAAARALAAIYPAVAVSCGVDGAMWADRTGLIARPAWPAPGRVVDTTGAGDAFAAGALAAWLSGQRPTGCLDAGSAAAASVLGRLGAQHGSWRRVITPHRR